MNNYVIGIGGTGSRCLKSLIHLCACGIIKGKDLTLMMIDLDDNCGDVQDLKTLLDLYINCQKIANEGNPESPIFNTKLIPYPGGLVWKPESIDDKSTIYNHFLASAKRENQNILKLFFYEKEQEEKLNNGFKGLANLGSTIMAKEIKEALSPGANKFFSKMLDDIAGTDSDFRVFLFSSIFGGMGASTFPTFAKIIKKQFESNPKFFLGGLLLMPYFSFQYRKESIPNGVYAKSEYFLGKTKEALKFYQKEFGVFDSLYFLGDQFFDDSEEGRSVATGGDNQKNPAHFLEMWGALATSHFFRNESTSKGLTYKATREEGGKKQNAIDFRDLANEFPPTNIFHNQLLYFTCFSFAFEFFSEVIFDPRFPYDCEKFLWFRRHFTKGVPDQLHRPVDRGEIKDPFLKYFSHYNSWIHQIHNISKRAKKIHLFRRGLVKDPDEENKIRDVLYGKRIYIQEDRAYSRLLEIMNGNQVKTGKHNEPLPRFIDFLYDSVKELCRENYKIILDSV